MLPRQPDLPVSVPRRTGIILLAAFALARPAAAQSMQPVGTQAGSGITIQATNVYNGLPMRGYLPVRVTITNGSGVDGQWLIETQANNANGNYLHFGAMAVCNVPAHATHVFEVLAPVPGRPEGDGIFAPRQGINLHFTGPGVTSPDVLFTPNLMQPSAGALITTIGRGGSVPIASGGGFGPGTITSTGSGSIFVSGSVLSGGRGGGSTATVINGIPLQLSDGKTVTPTGGTMQLSPGVYVVGVGGGPVRTFGSGRGMQLSLSSGQSIISDGSTILLPSNVGVSSRGGRGGTSISSSRGGGTTITTSDSNGRPVRTVLDSQPDGTQVTTIVRTRADLSTQTTIITTHPDGTSQATTGFADASGMPLTPPGPGIAPPVGLPPPSGAGTTTLVSPTGMAFISTGARGGPVTQQRRSAGPALFVGISPTLSHDHGDAIKNYFLNICARPIEQSTLDPDLLSTDWRAYLGFDLMAFTATDWLAVAPAARTAIMQWVAAGGDFRLVANQDGGLGLPPRQGEYYGAGSIELFSDEDLALYNYSVEHTDPRERYLFSLNYQPKATDSTGSASEAMQAIETTISPAQLATITSGIGSVNDNDALKAFFTSNGIKFPYGTGVTYDRGTEQLQITNTAENSATAVALLRYNADGRGVTQPEFSPVAAAPTPSAIATSPKPEASTPKFADVVPHLVNHFLLIAGVIVIFFVLVGPLNLFWFCSGPRRAHLLWVTPALALVAGAAILAFILLADGIGGRGVYYRLTQLAPDGKFAVESELESSVTGWLTRHEFQTSAPAWMLGYMDVNGSEWTRGDFTQTGGQYEGDWLNTRREQTLFARTIVPSRAALRLVSGGHDGGPPVLRSDFNGWLEKVFYMDEDGHCWKADRISDGQSTHLTPVSDDEFTAAWDENMRGAPDLLQNYLRKLTPRPGTFFALGNGDGSSLEPAITGLRWTRYRHVILGPVEL